MKVIMGLGNPSAQYAHTRHNAGAIFVEWLAKHKFACNDAIHNARYTLYAVNKNLTLCLPTTYMNESGKAVHALKRKFNTLTPQDIIVVHDDLEHRVGNVRVKEGGSAEGHNGISSIIDTLGTNKFKRLQLGIARPPSKDPEMVARYVLAKFPTDEDKLFRESFAKAVQLLRTHQFI